MSLQLANTNSSFSQLKKNHYQLVKEKKTIPDNNLVIKKDHYHLVKEKKQFQITKKYTRLRFGKKGYTICSLIFQALFFKIIKMSDSGISGTNQVTPTDNDKRFRLF